MDLPAAVKHTQETLGTLVKRPPLTEKLLSRPPFRFLHDVISAVISETGFMSGLYTPDELHADNIKDRDSKMAFLQKALDCVQWAAGEPLTMKPAKTVAGQDADKTNEFLALLYKASQAGDGATAVQKVLENQKPDFASGGSADSNKENRQDRTERENRTSTKVSDKKSKESESKTKGDSRSKASSSKAPDAAVANGDVPRDGGRQHSTDRKERSDPSTKTRSSSKDSKEKDRKERSDKDRKSKERSKESDKSKERSKESEKSKERSKESDKSKERSKESEKSKERSKASDKSKERSKELGRTKERSKESDKVRKPRSNSRPKDGATKEDSKDPTTKDSEPRKTDKPRIHEADLADEPSEPKQLLSPKPAASPRDANRASPEAMPEPEAIPAVPAPQTGRPTTAMRRAVPAARPVSAIGPRPTTARPAPPRVRKALEAPTVENVPSREGSASHEAEPAANIIAEDQSQPKEEEDQFIVQETDETEMLVIGQPDEQETAQEDVLEDEDHGGLVRKILETKKDLESGLDAEDDEKKGVSVFDEKEREKALKDAQKMQQVLQGLTRTSHPLGRLLDFLQEDIDTMLKEISQWQAEYKQNTLSLRQFEGTTASTLEPSRVMLERLEKQISEQRQKIAASKANTMETLDRIGQITTSMVKR